MRLGRFIVETYCHAQRIAARMQDDDTSYERLAQKMRTAVPADEAEDDEVVLYDNSERFLYDMDVNLIIGGNIVQLLDHEGPDPRLLEQ